MSTVATDAPRAAPAVRRTALLAEDLDHCEAAIRTGSRSFFTASKLLPGRVRRPALALYAFCRLSDDAVDLTREKPAAILALRDRLDLVYRGTPRNAPADRAFAAIVEEFEMPRALPEALLEGLAWDAQGRRYRTIDDLHSYSARVAAAVGAMMCVLMRVRDADALARACDLGLAMQLTNIARDVGEDAREGRLFLPTDWMEGAGIDTQAFLADPQPTAPVCRVVRRLLAEADRLYFRSEAGIAALPLSVRPGIAAARHIYAAIGTRIACAGHDSITQRAYTGPGAKLWGLATAGVHVAVTLALPRPVELHALPEPSVAFLVNAAAHAPPARETWAQGRSAALLSVLSDLESRDRARRGLMGRATEPNCE
ncbi:15-cis-phytoene synthase [Rhodobaculum claviforme]|uniref:Phytoene synthase n=1 Tax=Rhodobaculum claviforme TaxID=1549854 RepID=A0A934TMA2_9RHOB|nr:phytoene/squalene synthase family protein [Rhodobaculum claviforme]MBK5927777.1 phytoene synthase [Rhodobaculum claviforme]